MAGAGSDGCIEKVVRVRRPVTEGTAAAGQRIAGTLIAERQACASLAEGLTALPCRQVPKPLAPDELDRLKQEIAAELEAQLAADTNSKQLTEEQLAQVRRGGGARQVASAAH